MSDNKVKEQNELSALLEAHESFKYGTDEYNAWVSEVRAALEALVGQTWTLAELEKEITIDSFAYGFVYGTRKSDGAEISLDFMHRPRFYYSLVVK